ncbi:hypothetical protein CEXT_239721 [Caerostris extrusa]|uniref:Uncharacterized protein n=1 Tax=Caerostris extrusa TaxID=172846 RepID=A0AAV4WH85_CAEEX|nr:hypothetical protein CEXT_239721 [Caerostris extrusa]
MKGGSILRTCARGRALNNSRRSHVLREPNGSRGAIGYARECPAYVTINVACDLGGNSCSLSQEDPHRFPLLLTRTLISARERKEVVVFFFFHL